METCVSVVHCKNSIFYFFIFLLNNFYSVGHFVSKRQIARIVFQWSQSYLVITDLCGNYICSYSAWVWRTGASGRTDKFPVEAQKKGHTIRYLWNTYSKWMHWKMTLQLISYPASFCFLSISEVFVSLSRC